MQEVQTSRLSSRLGMRQGICCSILNPASFRLGCLLVLASISAQAWAQPSAAPDWPDSESVWAEPSSKKNDLQQTQKPKPAWLEPLNLNGYLKNETAYRFHEPRTITKIRNIAYLEAAYGFTASRNLVVNGWAYHDLAYDLFDYETIAGRFVRDEGQPLVFIENLAQEKDSNVIEIREIYLDLFTENMDIRLGKQIVVWGVFDGIRVVDEINPQDFRELITPDLLDYRIPLWTAKVDYFQDDSDWQFLWIPDIRFHKPAPPGSEWELLQEVTNTTYPRSFTFKNSEFGLRYSSKIKDAQYSLSYFHTWDDFPVIFRTVKLDSAVEPDYFPTYTQIDMYGATFVKPMGGAILKAEIAYVPNKYFGLKRDVDRNNDDYLDSEGVLRLPHYRWALGVDFNMWGIDFSPALTQWIILNYVDGLIQDKQDTSLTLFMRKPLPEHSLVMQMLAISLVNLNELYLKPEVTFEIGNHHRIALGMDLFFGNKSLFGVSVSGGAVSVETDSIQNAQFVGNFNDNDRIFVEYKYTF